MTTRRLGQAPSSRRECSPPREPRLRPIFWRTRPSNVSPWPLRRRRRRRPATPSARRRPTPRGRRRGRSAARRSRRRRRRASRASRRGAAAAPAVVPPKAQRGAAARRRRRLAVDADGAALEEQVGEEALHRAVPVEALAAALDARAFEGHQFAGLGLVAERARIAARARPPPRRSRATRWPRAGSGGHHERWRRARGARQRAPLPRVQGPRAAARRSSARGLAGCDNDFCPSSGSPPHAARRRQLRGRSSAMGGVDRISGRCRTRPREPRGPANRDRKTWPGFGARAVALPRNDAESLLERDRRCLPPFTRPQLPERHTGPNKTTACGSKLARILTRGRPESAQLFLVSFTGWTSGRS